MLSGKRRTKIVCTLGPSSNTLEDIERLYRAGMNVVRINFSHGSHEGHKKTIGFVREVAKKHKYSIPVLMDLQGPKIRVGSMRDGAQQVKEGDIVDITSEDVMDAIEGLAGAGNSAGIPTEQVLRMGQGISDIMKEDYKRGFAQLLGWSTYFVDGGKSKTSNSELDKIWDSGTKTKTLDDIWD